MTRHGTGRGKCRRGNLFCFLPAAGALLVSVIVAASPLTEVSLVVARVGSKEVTADDLLKKWSQLTPEQRQGLGESWSTQRARLVEDLTGVRAGFEALSSTSSEPAKLLKRASWRRRHALSTWANEVGLQPPPAGMPASSAAVAELYKANSHHFVRPTGLLLWRILVAGESGAQSVLDELQRPSGRSWKTMAREVSLDEATSMRSGELGYVEANGHTHRPQVRVSAQLYAAAAAYGKIGVLPEPVSEGNFYAVLWLRDVKPELVDSVQAVRATLAALLAAKASEEARSKLYLELRDRYVSRVRPNRISKAHFKESNVGLRDVFARVSPLNSEKPRLVSMRPSMGPRGLR